MSHKTAVTVAHTIGIDPGKNTLHLIGLDDKGAIVLREKIARGTAASGQTCRAAQSRKSTLPRRQTCIDSLVMSA